MTVLAERWWEITNTFHFTTFEATLTPLITGIRVGGDSISFDPDIYRTLEISIYLLGRVSKQMDRDRVRYTWALRGEPVRANAHPGDFMVLGRIGGAFLQRVLSGRAGSTPVTRI
ncbi:hypothetical protein U1Q18_007775 [Sarracenia purpurea var. burkii]